MKLNAFVINAITKKRRELLKPKLKKEVASRMINAEFGGGYLFGPNMDEKIKERDEEDKLAAKILAAMATMPWQILGSMAGRKPTARSFTFKRHASKTQGYGVWSQPRGQLNRGHYRPGNGNTTHSQQHGPPSATLTKQEAMRRAGKPDSGFRKIQQRR